MVSQEFRRFSIRRLNPFNGVLQVFSGESARALSGNGAVWEIQVLSDTPQGLWANIPFSGKEFYTFGRWSPDTGLQQVPVNPLFNVRDMIASAEQLIAALSAAVETLPFPPADPYELWLLDEQKLTPVALLASCQNSDQLDQAVNAKWIAAERGDFSFVSANLLQRGLANNDGYNPRVHASILEATVRGRGGQRHRRAWFRRCADGSHTPCEPAQDDIDPCAFPRLPITETWEDEEDRRLVADYIAWRAPQLLQLHGLHPETRQRLEQIAVSQSETVERLWRLYPEIHNKDLLNRARVEAKIRSANRK
ncbi:MAG: hypothetical protein KME56_14235 [Candidatus Thiodiazotropha sp. (ex Ctena orbiculata)]|uniref:Uncharacterized protein n=1 Tax=Candidatus Thiodiazotropha taylori TaxID=2792791 RepID=A0A944MBB1_9GAMM|nr:hypothetical protein [Candidatus Thiodiazotropha taylori]MBT2990816.1 hypothetical protein [Candidatus Thiodiazotropha taylori]MBT2997766.1 hypothetical protein [Candidatus Thiodiazotropha taylori]MBT3000465.1 hypothetical protein [Candidatus Thiodiazotropha taylori]MBT3027469.1 hypothetical protein [Candidatus Thiodiazotropha taylori]